MFLNLCIENGNEKTSRVLNCLLGNSSISWQQSFWSSAYFLRHDDRLIEDESFNFRWKKFDH